MLGLVVVEAGGSVGALAGGTLDLSVFDPSVVSRVVGSPLVGGQVGGADEFAV